MSTKNNNKKNFMYPVVAEVNLTFTDNSLYVLCLWVCVCCVQGKAGYIPEGKRPGLISNALYERKLSPSVRSLFLPSSLSLLFIYVLLCSLTSTRPLQLALSVFHLALCVFFLESVRISLWTSFSTRSVHVKAIHDETEIFALHLPACISPYSCILLHIEKSFILPLESAAGLIGR